MIPRQPENPSSEEEVSKPPADLDQQAKSAASQGATAPGAPAVKDEEEDRMATYLRGPTAFTA